MRLLCLWWLIPGLLCACQSNHSAFDSDEGGETGGSHYIVKGDVTDPGGHEIHPGDTIASVLSDDLVHTHGVPITVVLRRHGPEGKTRELIQLSADGKLMDEKQNYVLRDGDELIFPPEH